MQGSWPCIYIYIQRDGIRSRHEMAVRESLASQGRRREPGRQLPGVLHISRDPWGRLEGALRASWDYHRITVRLPLTIARCPSDFPFIIIQNRAETIRFPPRFPYGAPTGLVWPSTGCLRPVCSRTVSWKCRENWEQLAQHNGARATSKNFPGPLRIVGHPTGTAQKWTKLLFLFAIQGP